MKASNIQKQENRKKAESLDVYRDSRIPSTRTWERPDELLLITAFLLRSFQHVCPLEELYQVSSYLPLHCLVYFVHI